jgi:hypothetical protein
MDGWMVWNRHELDNVQQLFLPLYLVTKGTSGSLRNMVEKAFD